MILVKAFYCEGRCVQSPGPFDALGLRCSPLLVRTPEGTFQALFLSSVRHSVRRWKEHLADAGVTVERHSIFRRGARRHMRERAQALLQEHRRVCGEPAAHFEECLLYLDRRRSGLSPPPPPAPQVGGGRPLSSSAGRSRHLFQF